MQILQNPSYDGYVASFNIRSLHDLCNSHFLEDVAQVKYYGRQNSARTHSTKYIHTYNAAHLQSKAPTHQKLNCCSMTAALPVLLPTGILPPPSSHYAFFPAKLKFGVCFKKCYFQFFIFFLVLIA
jgi:hypothetical protein